MHTYTAKTKRAEQKKAISLSETLLETSKNMNTVYTDSKRVRAVFHTHFVDMKSKEFGIADLIVKILKANSSVFPASVETTNLRNVAIAGAMFTQDIAESVADEFSAGSIRYPLDTIKHYLSTVLFGQNKVGKIQLTNAEDSNRECPKPRCKWYLIESPKTDTKQ